MSLFSTETIATPVLSTDQIVAAVLSALSEKHAELTSGLSDIAQAVNALQQSQFDQQQMVGVKGGGSGNVAGRVSEFNCFIYFLCV